RLRARAPSLRDGPVPRARKARSRRGVATNASGPHHLQEPPRLRSPGARGTSEPARRRDALRRREPRPGGLCIHRIPRAPQSSRIAGGDGRRRLPVGAGHGAPGARSSDRRKREDIGMKKLTDIGKNVTGIGMSPIDGKAMTEFASNGGVPEGDESALAEVREEFANE